MQTQRLLEWLPSHYDEVASELNIGKDSRASCLGRRGATDESHMWKRRFPYEQYNKWSHDPAEKRRWTQALEKWGPKRVEVGLSDRALGCVRPHKCRGDERRRSRFHSRDWLAWREQHQINWTMWAMILGIAVGDCYYALFAINRTALPGCWR